MCFRRWLALRRAETAYEVLLLVPAVVTMRVRQIYVMPRAVVLPTPAYLGFGCNFPAKAARAVKWAIVGSQITCAWASSLCKLEVVMCSEVRALHALPAKKGCTMPVEGSTAWLRGQELSADYDEDRRVCTQMQLKRLAAQNRHVQRPSAPTGLVGPNLEVPLNKGVERLTPQEARPERAPAPRFRAACLSELGHKPVAKLAEVPELVKRSSEAKLVAGSSGLLYWSLDWSLRILWVILGNTCHGRCVNWYHEQ
ncbi:unnamed protein product, partial [Symbiodinium sp. KB8]